MSPNCFGISFTWKLALLVGETFKNPKTISLLKKSNRSTTIQGCKAVWIHGSLDSWQFGFMAIWIHGSLDSWQFGCMAIHETTHPPATCGLPKSKCFLCTEPLLLLKCHSC